MLGLAGWAFFQGLGGAASAQTQPELALAVAVSLLATAISAFFVYYFRRRADAGERRAAALALARPATWGWIGLAVFIATAASIGATQIAREAAVEMTPTNGVLGELAGDYPWLLIVFAVLIAPAYEELLFRRVLFGRFWAAGRPGLGIVLSASAFALVHEPPGLGTSQGLGMVLLWLVYAAMGAAFAWIYRRTGSLWAPYLAHAGNNLLAVLTLLAMP